MNQSKQVDDAGTEPWTWILPDGHASSDWIRYRRRLEAVAAHRGFELNTLGTVCAEPLLMLHGGASHPSAPRLLVASGFHGEEPAGPWGVLEFLEAADQDLLSHVQLTKTCCCRTVMSMAVNAPQHPVRSARRCSRPMRPSFRYTRMAPWMDARSLVASFSIITTALSSHG